MKNCLTKSDDMFMSIRIKDNDPTKFGQLIIPALPESVLTDVPGSQRKRMVNHLAKLDMEKCFEYVLSVSTSVGEDMNTHLYIIMVVLHEFMDLDEVVLVESARKVRIC